MNRTTHPCRLALCCLAFCCLALTGLGCASQTLFMARTSSGAVDRDVEFTPTPGADGHFISLPAYPLANCTDTLVYDRLVDDLDAMLRELGQLNASRARSTNRRDTGQNNQAAALDFWNQFLATQAGKLLTDPDLAGADRAALGEGFARFLHPPRKAANKQNGGLADSMVSLGSATKPSASQSPEDRTHSLMNVKFHRVGVLKWKRESLMEWSARDGDGFKRFVQGFVATSATDFETLLQTASKDQFTAKTFDDALRALGIAGDLTQLANAAADFVSLADDYGPAPCSSQQRYRGFLGFRNDELLPHDQPLPEGEKDAGNRAKPTTFRVSWLDRSPCEQLQSLQAIEDLLEYPTKNVKSANKGTVEPRPSREACRLANSNRLWPKPIQSFLHFSDVQIREPSAKLGGTELSHDLKALEPSFEQDYVQAQYAMFVYDALVKTANAEICLHLQGDPRCPPMPARPSWATPTLGSQDETDRPAPTLMIHTGDSVDSGLQSEFETFRTVTDSLNVHWYQAIGNHDALAFGNLQLASQTAPQLEDAYCRGSRWNGVGCSCTSLNTLVRAKEIRTPDNRGNTNSSLPNTTMPIFPLLLQRVCLLHAVAADWFVMDPDKSGSKNAIKSFVLSHCKGWNPRPGEVETADTKRNEGILAGCLLETKDHAPAGTDHSEEVASVPGAAVSSKSAPAPVAQPPALHCATRGEASRSKFHGFDLIANFEGREEMVPVDHGTPHEANAELGYYCFEMQPGVESADSPRVWAVVLNTNTDAGSFGYISGEQLTWLARLLEATGQPTSSIGARDLVLLFAHHPIWAIADQEQRLSLTDLVTRSPNVVGYFAGHTHQSALRVIRPLSGSAGTAKWEFIAPSVVDYPQAVRQVTLKSHGTLGYIEVLTFKSTGTGPAVEKIKAAELGAMRDRCASNPEQCVNGYPLLPGREVTFPRAFFKMP